MTQLKEEPIKIGEYSLDRVVEMYNELVSKYKEEALSKSQESNHRLKGKGE